MRIPHGVLAAAAVAAGIAVARGTDPSSDAARGFLLLATLAPLPALLRRRVPTGVTLLACLFLLTLARAPRLPRTSPPLPPAVEGLFEITGEIASPPWRAPDEPWRFALRDAGGRTFTVVSDTLPELPEIGDRWSATGRLEVRRPLQNFGAHAPRTPRPRLLTASCLTRREQRADSPFERLGRPLRRRARERLLAHLGPERAGPSAALLLGIPAALPPEPRERTRRTGVAHLVVVSGLHLGLFVWLPARLLAWLGWRRRPRAFALLALVLAYGALTGAAVPVRRAILLWAMHALADLLGRPASSWNAWGFAAAIELHLDPTLLDGLAFQLSYAAVAGILWAQRAGSTAGWLGGSALRASLGATLATLPILHATIGAFSLHGVWLTPLLTPFVAASLLLGFVGLACDAAALTRLGAAVLEGFLDTLVLVDALPGTPSVVGAAPVLVSVAWSAAGLLALRGRWRTAVVGAVAALVLGWGRGREPERVAEEAVAVLEVLDVGHGSCALLHVPGHGNVLFDAGSRHQDLAAADALRARLRAFGVAHLDALVVSHGDADHHNLLPRLAPGPSATFTVAPPTVRGLPGRRLDVRGGALAWTLGPATLRLRPSALPDTAASNDRSLLLEIEVCGRRALLFGDHEWAALAEHVPHLGPADLVLWPHHGRTTQGARTLLRRCRPRVVFASDAGDPVPGARAGAWFTTGRSGALRWIVRRDGSLRIETANGEGLEDAGSAPDDSALSIPGKGG